MKKLISLTILLSAFLSFSQEDFNPKFWDKVRYGGALGLGFGNNTTNITIAPSAIYQYNESVAFGVSLGYQYAKRDDVKSNVYSAGVLNFYNPIPEIQLSTEFEQLFVNSSSNNFKESYSYPALYFGAAYQISPNFVLGIRYDVLYDNNQSIYASAFSPIVRIFF